LKLPDGRFPAKRELIGREKTTEVYTCKIQVTFVVFILSVQINSVAVRVVNICVSPSWTGRVAVSAG